MFDRPAAGRSFFEQLIRDHLDVGQPEKVALIFGRRINRCTPGTFCTKVITTDVDPQISCYYKVRSDQTVFQGAPGVAHRDGGLRHSRLRHRPAGDTPTISEPTGGRQ